MKYIAKICLIILSILCLCMLPSCKRDEGVPEGGFTLKARITALGEKLEVEVYDSDYAYGTYWVITPAATTYESEDGTAISRGALAVGDRIEITYGGQVMQSYPPQIVAKSIRIIAE